MSDTSRTPEILRHRPFLLLCLSRFFTTLGNLTQGVTLGWQVYSLARQTSSVEHSAFLVGMIGLAQFLPLFALTLPAGATADRHDRRTILLACIGGHVLCALALLGACFLPRSASMIALFAVAAVLGAIRAFAMPASTALAPTLIPQALLPKAIAWNTLSLQGGMILGPWLGGLLSAFDPSIAYGAVAGLCATSFALIAGIPRGVAPAPGEADRLSMIRDGLRYVWRTKLVLGAISLDLFAVLLGGATALLPVYARDILQIGPSGFGLLRSGPAIGGGLVALWLGRYPLQRRTGPWMLGGVGLFGAATIVFGLSHSVILSMAALIVLGGADVISMFVRQSLVQIATPDAMRGRVSAVSTLFISASNELGEFESGVLARLIGPVGSAVSGGIGSVLVTVLWARLFPALRQADRLHEVVSKP